MKITLDIPDDLYEKLTEMHKGDLCDVNAMMVEALNRYVGERRSADPSGWISS